MFASQKRATLLSWLLHCGAILLILAVTGVKPPNIPLLHELLVTPADLIAYKTTPHTGGGGGGGVRADSPASQGVVPPMARLQFVPPSVDIPNDHPILPMAPTLIGDTELQPVNFDVTRYGVLNGADKLSGGRGRGNGIGEGEGTGVGDGKGPGKGPGENGGEGGGSVEFGGFGKGSISPPVLLAKYEPEYSEEARRARLQGTVVLRIEVDTHGQAQNITVTRSLGLGLDDRAIEAVKRWKFGPGKLNGKPAAVVAYVEVNFRLL